VPFEPPVEAATAAAAPVTIESEGSASDERSLVARAQAGDETAFRELVERHKDRAYGLALRIVRSPADAEEVAQDGFVRAWLALPRFRGESRFSTWLHRIVARRALDRAEILKRRGAREAAMEDIPEAESAATGASGSSDSLAMEHLVSRLSEAQRTVVTLFYYEDRSVEQVATLLGMPTGTVKTHLSRARAALREAWSRQRRESLS